MRNLPAHELEFDCEKQDIPPRYRGGGSGSKSNFRQLGAGAGAMSNIGYGCNAAAD